MLNLPYLVDSADHGLGKLMEDIIKGLFVAAEFRASFKLLNGERALLP